MYYCVPGRREPEITLNADDVYPAPAINLAGPYLGYAARASDGLDDADNIVVVDVRRNRLVNLAPLTGGVGSLRVSTRGSVAWIECPTGQITAGKLDCATSVGRGEDNTLREVYRRTRRAEDRPGSFRSRSELLARSHRIEIRSLHRKHGRIYWTQAHRTRHASFD